MKQLIEKQKKEFEKKYNTSVLIAYPEYAESHMILLTDIWNWHKQSLKQFIDGLVEREIAKTYIGLQDAETSAWNEAKEETIAHLKKLKEELN